jgi:hypothetical protein
MLTIIDSAHPEVQIRNPSIVIPDVSESPLSVELMHLTISRPSCKHEREDKIER